MSSEVPNNTTPSSGGVGVDFITTHRPHFEGDDSPPAVIVSSRSVDGKEERKEMVVDEEVEGAGDPATAAKEVPPPATMSAPTIVDEQSTEGNAIKPPTPSAKPKQDQGELSFSLAAESASNRPGTEPKEATPSSLVEIAVGTEWTQERRMSAAQDTSDLQAHARGGQEGEGGTYFQRVELMVDSKLTRQNIPMDVQPRSSKALISLLEKKFGMRLTVSFSAEGRSGRAVQLPPLKNATLANNTPHKKSREGSASRGVLNQSLTSNRSQRSFKRSPSRAYRMSPIRTQSLSSALEKSNTKHKKIFAATTTGDDSDFVIGDDNDGALNESKVEFNATTGSSALRSPSPQFSTHSRNRTRSLTASSTIQHSTPPTRRELKHSTFQEFLAFEPDRRVLHCRPLFPSALLLEQKYAESSSMVASPEAFLKCTGRQQQQSRGSPPRCASPTSPEDEEDTAGAVYQGSLVASGHRNRHGSIINLEASPNRLSKKVQQGMIDRLLYKSVEKRSRKLAALDAKFYPTEGQHHLEEDPSRQLQLTSSAVNPNIDSSAVATNATTVISPAKLRCISPTQEKQLIQRLAGGGAGPSPQKLKSLERAERDNNAAMGIRPAPRVSSSEREQLTDRFYNGGRDWKKKAEEKNEKNRFKSKTNFTKKRAKAEWDAWQEKMAREIGKDVRLKNQLY